MQQQQQWQQQQWQQQEVEGREARERDNYVLLVPCFALTQVPAAEYEWK